MTSLSPNSSVEERIAAARDRLTPTERRIAQEVSADPSLLVFGNVSELAQRVGISRPSVSRFATKLGFEGFAELQRWARDGVSDQLSRPGDRIRQPQDGLPGVRAALEGALEHVFRVLDGGTLQRLAHPLAVARRVWVLSGETSRAGAHALHTRLALLRAGVHLVEQHDLGRDLSGATADDAAVVIDFPRYRRSTVAAARTLHDVGVSLVVLTDGPLSPLAPLSPLRCELGIPAVGPFDSSVPSVAAAELLAVEVARQLGGKARAKIDRLEHIWSETDTFFEDA